MKRIIVIWLLFVVLIASAVWEEIYISSSLNKLEQKTQVLEQCIETDYSSNTTLNAIDNLESFWIEQEKVLCLIINYKEIKDIISQIVVLKEAINQGEEETIYIELEKLKSYIVGCKNVIGFNIQNVL